MSLCIHLKLAPCLALLILLKPKYIFCDIYGTKLSIYVLFVTFHRIVELSVLFLIISICCVVNASSSHDGHLNAWISCKIIPSISKSNFISWNSIQQEGQRRLFAFMLLDLFREFFPKLFSPSLYLS